MLKSEYLRDEISIVILEDNDGDFVLIEDYLIEIYKSVKLERFDRYETFINRYNEGKVACDLILLDLHLPDISGIKLVEETAAKFEDIPLIILTGYADLPLAKKSLEMGIDDFLIKDDINNSLLHKSIEFALSRNNYIQHIQHQNQILRKIAWSQSHEVRGPLARILGVINLIDTVEINPQELKYLLEELKCSAQEMDEIVHAIVQQSQSIKLNNE